MVADGARFTTRFAGLLAMLTSSGRESPCTAASVMSGFGGSGQDSSVRHYWAFRPHSRFSRPGELARVLAGSHFRRVRHRKAHFCDAHHILKATAALASRVSMESRIMGE
jgi:hypothetical protein